MTPEAILLRRQGEIAKWLDRGFESVFRLTTTADVRKERLRKLILDTNSADIRMPGRQMTYAKAFEAAHGEPLQEDS